LGSETKNELERKQRKSQEVMSEAEGSAITPINSLIKRLTLKALKSA